MKNWHIAVIALVIVAVAVGGFFGGRAAAGGGAPTVEEAMKVLQNATPAQLQQAFANGNGVRGAFPGAGGTGANGTRTQGGAPVSGSIIGADATSITVKTSDGSTKIVLISESTPISKTTDGTLSDLTPGQNVIVTGTTNSDGTVTATRVQVGTNLPTLQNRTQSTSSNGTASGSTGTSPASTGNAPGAAGAAPGATPTPPMVTSTTTAQ